MIQFIHSRRRYCRCRQKTVMDSLNVDNPNQYAVGVKDVSVEDKNNPTKRYYFYGYSKNYFMHEGMSLVPS